MIVASSQIQKENIHSRLGTDRCATAISQIWSRDRAVTLRRRASGGTSDEDQGTAYLKASPYENS